MVRPSALHAFVGAVALVGLLALLGCGGRQDVRTSLSVAEALAADTAGFARALEPRTLRFPDDHGPHPSYRTEWWYYTGNVTSSNGRRFGYQLTFFRNALRPDTSDAAADHLARDSTWSTRQLYMAHFAVSDATTGRFLTAERFSRGAAGLAGAQSDPFKVWLEDWSIEGESADSIIMVARGDDMALDLILTRTKPIVLHGDGGLDAKGPEPGNASYYYSMTRLQTEGTVSIGGESFAVTGSSWMDHEWSTSVLGADLVGWDWFSLQLDNGHDIMFYQLRDTSGAASPYSSGVIVDSTGRVTRLERSDVELDATDYWTSPETENRYPVAWAFRVPRQDLDLRIEAGLRNQELTHTVTYWEGAVRVRGSASGSGFVELTGYGASDGRLSVR